MAVTVAPITTASVSASRTVRLDPRYHFLRGLASPMIEALRDPIRFSRVADFRNGLNLPRASYGTDDEEAIALYASVAAFPVYVLRRDACVPLRGNASGAIIGDSDRSRNGDGASERSTNHTFASVCAWPRMAWRVGTRRRAAHSGWVSYPGIACS